MKTLWLLRHAKSSWDDPSLDDHDRPLAPRGVRAGRLIAAHVESSAIQPSVVLCSSARRAVETLGLLRPALDERTDMRTVDRLYGAGASEILDVLHTLDAIVGSALVIGHNPGLHDLAVALAGSGDEAAITQLRIKYPTAALVTLRCPAESWSDLGAGQAELVGLVLPRTLA